MTPPAKNFAPEKGAAAPEQKAAGPVFAIKETHLLGRLGLSRDALRALRAEHLTEGVDWAHEHRSVMLTAGAVEKIAAAIKLTAEAPRLVLGLLTFPGCPGHPDQTPVVLKAWRFWPALKNRTILEAYFRGSDPTDRRNIVRVRVKDSSNFVPHMELPARLIQSPDLYECLRPGPRAKGRW